MQSNVTRCLMKIPFLCQKNVTFVVNGRLFLLKSPRVFIGSNSKWFHTTPAIGAERKKKPPNTTEIDVSREKPYTHLTFGEKAKEAGKTSFWGSVIIAGVLGTGVILAIIWREIFSSDSPNGVYGNAFKLCKQCTELTDVLGEPIKCYGEETRRGRRRHTSHVEFDAEGMHHLKMVFYVEGPHRKGKVHLQVQKSPGQRFEYRYLFVELYGYPPRTIVLQDNR